MFIGNKRDDDGHATLEKGPTATLGTKKMFNINRGKRNDNKDREPKSPLER